MSGFSPWKSVVLSSAYLCLSVSICGCIDLLRLGHLLRRKAAVAAALVCCVATLGFAGPSQPNRPSKPPNVLIILIDDQGYGDFSCLGNPVLKTPNLDKLHDQSVCFTDFHVAPMCTPTRGQLMSGRDCLANGAMNVSSGRAFLHKELPTMADIFSASGYRCGIFGKWHLGDNYPYRPQDRGFQETVWYPSSHIGSAPDYWDNDYFDDTYSHNGRRMKFTGYTTDVFFGEAMKWMRAQAAARQPFFCYLPTAAPHAPLFVADKYREPYKSQTRKVASFFGMIANIDENMDRLDAFLRETGLYDNTILIFMTDNGGTAGVPVFNAGMRGQKMDLWEGGHRVPCFIRWPAGKLRPPGDIAELTEVQDILPTLVDLCRLRKPAKAQFDGLSLAGLPARPARPPARPDARRPIQPDAIGRPPKGRRRRPLAPLAPGAGQGTLRPRHGLWPTHQPHRPPARHCRQNARPLRRLVVERRAARQ